MFSIHTTEHVIGTALECEVKRMACVLELEMSIENIARHVVRIRRGETNTVNSGDGVYLFEEGTEGGFHVGGCPCEGRFVPEFLAGEFAVAVDILSEEDNLACACLGGMSHLRENVLFGARYLGSPRRGYDTVGTVVIAACLDNDIRGGERCAGLLNAQVVMPRDVRPDVFFHEGGEYLRYTGDILDTECEINPVESREELVIRIKYRTCLAEELQLAGGGTLDIRWTMPSVESGLADHAARDADVRRRTVGTVVIYDRGYVAMDAVFAFFADRAGIEEDDICLGRIGRVASAGAYEDGVKLFGVSVVHRTAEGLNMIFHRNIWKGVLGDKKMYQGKKSSHSRRS